MRVEEEVVSSAIGSGVIGKKSREGNIIYLLLPKP
jgi:hypothetical protein